MVQGFLSFSPLPEGRVAGNLQLKEAPRAQAKEKKDGKGLQHLLAGAGLAALVSLSLLKSLISSKLYRTVFAGVQKGYRPENSQLRFFIPDSLNVVRIDIEFV